MEATFVVLLILACQREGVLDNISPLDLAPSDDPAEGVIQSTGFMLLAEPEPDLPTNRWPECEGLLCSKVGERPLDGQCARAIAKVTDERSARRTEP
ncbi:MAG: hypothetical protein HN348_10505 [Proteobacteria bacterium]|jgi:hypothetical protein|nr:hypothetical protein [Pseudomonadota bacterium]